MQYYIANQLTESSNFNQFKTMIEVDDMND